MCTVQFFTATRQIKGHCFNTYCLIRVDKLVAHFVEITVSLTIVTKYACAVLPSHNTPGYSAPDGRYIPILNQSGSTDLSNNRSHALHASSCI